MKIQRLLRKSEFLHQKSIFKLSQFERKNFQQQRNFFETEPIYPDLNKEFSSIRKNTKSQQWGQNSQQIEKVLEENKLRTYSQSKIFLRNQSQQRLKSSQQQKNNIQKLQQGQVSQTRQRILQNKVKDLAEKILIDQETNLMYGFGFDEFITEIRKESQRASESKYLETLQTILSQLGIKNDRELIQMYKYVIANKTAHHFKNQAREIILKNVLEEIKLKKVLNGEIQSEDGQFDLESLSEIKDSDLEKKQFELSLQKIEEKIRVNQTVETVNKKEGGAFSDFSDGQEEKELDLLIYKVKLDQGKDKKIKVDESKYFESKDQLLGHTIYKQIKQNFKKNIDKQRKETQSEELRSQESQQQLVEFLSETKTEKELQNFLRKYNLENEVNKKPDFAEILNNIDYLVENAPLSVKQKVQKNQEKEQFSRFEGRFLNNWNEMNERDLLWVNYQNSFLKIFPQGVYDDLEKEILEKGLSEKESEKSTDTILVQNLQESEERNNSLKDNTGYSLEDLKEDQRIEVEVYKRVQRDPFFTNYLSNELRFFADRMENGFTQIHQEAKELLEEKADIMPYYIQQVTNDLQNNLENEKEVKEEILDLEKKSEVFIEDMQKQDPENLTKNKKIFASGKRKQSSALCILEYDGYGRIQVNRKKYLDYFSHPFYRNKVLRAMYLADIGCNFNIRFYIHGGGVQAQAEAAGQALSRALVKLDPSLKQIFLDNGLVKSDQRQKEPKKTGRYKARKSWTYVRR